ncbi:MULTISPECIES: NAD(P)/FAD-dependent oxidoreductase [unclassified Arthrobacter]|uniref:flavin-containing monooxygenase n=1 Tax=unclassified Arthrobacter TaxID=235627 RepID=UPI001C8616B2|nr:NAD(P)/FAD-dependent oxidoreductase [Arthrobacter sp. MAHUQ-56]MBX7444386.1 NAD(P)/FAD-dependent oxidoreductase [Arthrobacter sp. MAHUQ-56]
MPSMQGTRSGTTRFDDLYWEANAEPIVDDDGELEKIVAQAELPVLLAAIAAALGDTSFLTSDLQPPLTLVDTQPHPHGGMSPDQQERAKALALEGLRQLRDKAITSVDMLEGNAVTDLLGFLTGGREHWHPSLKHELDLAPDKGGAPGWQFEEVADGRDFPVLIIGAGIAGIAAAYRYSQAGVPFTVVEDAPALGGTWAKNTYPGVRLDTPTFGYSYSFAQRGDWPHQFAEGGDVLDYVRDVAERAGLVESIELNTRLVRLVWDEESRAWQATTRHGGQEQVRTFAAVVSALGQLDRPNIPDFPGVEVYRGVTMHSQEWSHDADYRGKRVAVIGTGASAYQIVPALADEVDGLVLFQRSAPWMLPAPNYHDTVSDTFDWLRRKVPHYAQWYRLWVTLQGIPGRMHTVTAEDGWQGAPLSVSAKNQDVREVLIERLKEQFADRPELLENAIPNYPPGAKRMLRDNGVWAAALKSERTTVITAGIDRFTESGIVDNDGVDHEVDIVVFATGFKPSDYLDEVEVVGREGVEIHDFWKGDARAYNGVTVPGFPNFFLIYGPNVGGVVAGSLHFMIERAVEFSLKAVHEVLQRGASAIDVTPAALDRFVEWVDAGNRRMAWGQPYVRSWYQNSHGRVSQVWPYTNVEYWEATETVKADDHEFLA